MDRELLVVKLKRMYLSILQMTFSFNSFLWKFFCFLLLSFAQVKSDSTLNNMSAAAAAAAAAASASTSTSTSTEADLIEKSKKLAAELAVDEHVKSGMTLGIGSGSTIVYAIVYLGTLVKAGKLKDLICVPTSFQAKQLIIEHGLILGNLEENFDIDVCIDGADEIDGDLNCIKGGGGCHLQEKMVAFNAKRFVVIADYRKRTESKLGTQWTKGVPIAFIPAARTYLKATLITKHDADAVTLRMAKVCMCIILLCNAQCKRNAMHAFD